MANNNHSLRQPAGEVQTLESCFWRIGSERLTVCTLGAAAAGTAMLGVVCREKPLCLANVHLFVSVSVGQLVGRSVGGQVLYFLLSSTGDKQLTRRLHTHNISGWNRVLRHNGDSREPDQTRPRYRIATIVAEDDEQQLSLILFISKCKFHRVLFLDNIMWSSQWMEHVQTPLYKLP